MCCCVFVCVSLCVGVSVCECVLWACLCVHVINFEKLTYQRGGYHNFSANISYTKSRKKKIKLINAILDSILCYSIGFLTDR